MILFESLPDPWGKNIIVPVSLVPWKKQQGERMHLTCFVMERKES